MTRPIAEILSDIAARASELVLEVYETRFEVEFKGPSDPVTEADRRANELICRELEREFPGVPIVAEESEEESFADFRGSSASSSWIPSTARGSSSSATASSSS